MWLLLLALATLPPAPCLDRGTSVVVVTRARELVLCSGGRAIERFPVALGRGGVDKRRRGDGRTPIGTYSLGPPRPSALYGTFIPVGYPTLAQRRAGFTGSAVGIHGPRRWTRWLGRANTWVDWTRGCLALAPEDLARVAGFVRARGATTVHLE